LSLGRQTFNEGNLHVTIGTRGPNPHDISERSKMHLSLFKNKSLLNGSDIIQIQEPSPSMIAPRDSSNQQLQRSLNQAFKLVN